MKAGYPGLIFALLATAACSGTPSGPTPPVDPGPVVNNTPPVIGKFTVQGTRPNEPPDFADASEEVPVTVEVTDAESAISSLKFNWSADAGGKFSGTGKHVTWKAPASVPVPATAILTVEVVETYTSQGKSVENRVSGSTTISLHDSVKEVGDMALQFLSDFSDTSIKDVSYVMRNFEPTCYGTGEETSQVASHINDFDVISSLLQALATTISFGGICPFRTRAGDACSRVSAHWQSRAKHNIYYPTGELYLAAGGIDRADGVDQIAAMYYRNQHRWRLCDSQWQGGATSLREPIQSLVP